MLQSVSGASPVTFISEDTIFQHAGTQYQIPLPLIFYDPTQNPAVDLSAWPKFNDASFAASDKTLALTVVQHLINSGVLTPEPMA
jgi:hypothetical protein